MKHFQHLFVLSGLLWEQLLKLVFMVFESDVGQLYVAWTKHFPFQILVVLYKGASAASAAFVRPFGAALGAALLWELLVKHFQHLFLLSGLLWEQLLKLVFVVFESDVRQLYLARTKHFPL